MTPEMIAIELVSSLTTASTLFILAAGLTLVFGAMRVVNIAHGSLYMYGAFMMSVLAAIAGATGFWLGVIAAPLAMALLGAVIDLAVMRRIYRSDELLQLLTTYAIFLILGDLALRIWGTANRTVSMPAMFDGIVHLDGVVFPVYNVVVVALALFVGVALWFVLQRTHFGWSIRALVEDHELLAASGTNIHLLSTVVFAVSAMLAGLAGALIAPLEAVSQGMAANIIVAAFVVTVIGGLGSITGAAIGALIIGIFETIGTLLAPSWTAAFMYIAMIGVLVFKPSGLLGLSE